MTNSNNKILKFFTYFCLITQLLACASDDSEHPSESAPNIPQIELSRDDQNALFVTWPSDKFATSYRVYHSSDSNIDEKLPEFIEVKENFFKIPEANTATANYYRVSAIGKSAESFLSNTIHSQAPPIPPTAVQIELFQNNNLITWEGDGDLFSVYWFKGDRPESNTFLGKREEIQGNSFLHDELDVSSDEEIYYTVVSVNQGTESRFALLPNGKFSLKSVATEEDTSDVLGGRILNNGNFEQGELDWTNLDSTDNRTVLTNSSNCLGGAGNCLKIDGIKQFRHVDHLDVAVNPSQTYTFSGYAKVANLNTGHFKIHVKWFDASGGQITKFNVGIWNSNSDTYVNKEVTKTAPLNATSMRLEVVKGDTTNTGAIGYFDDINITSDGEDADTEVGTTDSFLEGISDFAVSLVDLSQEGNADWSHWGLYTADDHNYKNDVERQISDISLLGEATQRNRGTNFLTRYSWNDGAIIADTTNTNAGLRAYSVGVGFEFTVPASNIFRTLNIYAGIKAVVGKLTATLSDGGTDIYTETLIGGNTPSSHVISLNYKAASDNQLLTVRYVIESSPGTGWISLEAATLVGGSVVTGDITANVTIAPTHVDLTTEGTLDWLHLGLEHVDEENYKVQSDNQISEFQYTSTKLDATVRNTNNLTVYSWNDGLDTSSVTDTNAGIKTFAIDEGFRFTVPVDTNTKTLKLYVGAKNGKGTFTTSLVDIAYDPEVEQELTPIIKKTINSGTSPINRVITLNFKSPLPDKKILVEYKLTEKVSEALGWASLEAVTLQ